MNYKWEREALREQLYFYLSIMCGCTVFLIVCYYVSFNIYLFWVEPLFICWFVCVVLIVMILRDILKLEAT
jgi:hypothetical protein